MRRPPRDLHNTDDLSLSLRRCYIDLFLDRQVASWPAGRLVLDLGGNKIRKRGRFDLDRFSHRAVRVNLVPDKLPDVQGDAHLLPFADAVFDAVICTEVLEHVHHPEMVLQEAMRVLNADGQLLVTVPFLVPVHGDPEDYGRYTEAFWRKALFASGFVELSVTRQGLFWSVFLDMLRDYVVNSENRVSGFGEKMLRAVVAKAVVWGRRRAFDAEQGQETGRMVFGERYTTGYGMVARKSAGHSEVKMP